MSPLIIAIAAGVLVLTAVLVLLLSASSGRSSPQARLAQMGLRRQDSAMKQRERAAPQDRVPIITNLLGGTALWSNMQMEILRAGWLLRPSELVAMMFAGCVLAFGAGAIIFRAPWGGMALAPLGVVIPWSLMKSQQARRSKALSAQLPDALDMLSSALRAGFAFMRGVHLIQTQMHPPISEEMRRVGDEVQFGVSVEEALDNLVARTGNYDLELIAAAVQTQLQLGGNLSEVLDNISGTIRERVRLAAELQAATAEGRLSASILMAMPFAMAILVNMVNPGYIAPLFQSTLGWALVGLACVLLAVGGLIIKKLITVEI